MRNLIFLHETEMHREINESVADPEILIVSDRSDFDRHAMCSIDKFLSEAPLNRTTTIYLDVSEAEQLSKCLVKLTDFKGIVYARITGAYYRHMPLITISPPKSGTHLLIKLIETFGYKPGGILPLNPKGGHCYSLEFDSPHTSCLDYFRRRNIRGNAYGGRLSAFNACRAVAMFRHPRDIFKSALNYNFNPKNTVFGTFMEGAARKEKAAALVDPNNLAGDLPMVLNDMANWAFFPNVLAFSFEEFVNKDGRPNPQPVWEMMLRFHVPGQPRELLASAFGHSDTFSQGRVFADDNDVEQILPDVYAACDSYMTRLGYTKSSPRSDFFVRQRTRVRMPLDTRPIEAPIRVRNTDDFHLSYYNGRYVLDIKNISGTFRRLFSVLEPEIGLQTEDANGFTVRFHFFRIFRLDRSFRWGILIFNRLRNCILGRKRRKE